MRSLLLLLLCTSWLSSAHTITFMAEDLPPLHYLNKQGQPTGALVELTDKVCAILNHHCKIEIAPMARVFHKLEVEPNTVMISLLRTPERESRFIWLGESYYNKAVLMGLKGNASLQTKLDPNTQVIGTVRGYYSERFLKRAGFNEQTSLVLTKDVNALWHLLEKGRVDYVLTNTMMMEQELKSLNLSPDLFMPVLTLEDFPNKLYFAANPTMAPNVASELTVAIKKATQSAQYQALLKRWHLASL